MVFGQSNIRLNNYWVSSQYINPATIYDKYVAVFSVATRQQWIGFPGAPSTYFASASTYIDNLHTQLGLVMVQDQIGYTSTTNIDLTYGYAVSFQHDWQLHLGLGGNYEFVNFDVSKINMSTPIEPIVFNNLATKSNFNADFGLEITNPSFKIGAASQNIISLFSPVNVLQPNTNFLYGRYRQNSNNIINFGLGVCGIQYSDLYQMEFNLTSYFKVNQHSGLKDKPDLFDLGLFYRTTSEAGLIFGFDISKSIHLSYSYDFNFGGIINSSIGTNELIITYNLNKRPVCHNCFY